LQLGLLLEALDEGARKMEAQYDVVWPLGRSRVEEVAANERPLDLSGKTIAFIWDYLFKGPEMFEAVKGRLSTAFPGVRYVDYQVFGNIHGSDAEEKANLSALPTRLREHGVDAVVLAVGA
jgi:hypothetical protein